GPGEPRNGGRHGESRLACRGDARAYAGSARPRVGSALGDYHFHGRDGRCAVKHDTWENMRDNCNEALKLLGSMPVAIHESELDPEHAQGLLVGLSDQLTALS